MLQWDVIGMEGKKDDAIRYDKLIVFFIVKKIVRGGQLEVKTSLRIEIYGCSVYSSSSILLYLL